MATAQLAPPTGEQRFLLAGVDWQSYTKIADGFGERPVRATFDGGRLELMTTSPRHEAWKSTFALLIPILCEELGVEFACFGSMTIRREDLERGFEPDECYYIQNEPAVHGRLDLDMDHDPPPDLGIEVEVSRSALDRISIYAAMRVREVWRFDGEDLHVLHLNASGQYDDAAHSLAFPTLPVPEFVRIIRQRETMSDTQLMRAFRTWVRANVAPPAAGGPPAPAL
jgi:Uma2 family endonuclease